MLWITVHFQTFLLRQPDSQTRLKSLNWHRSVQTKLIPHLILMRTNISPCYGQHSNSGLLSTLWQSHYMIKQVTAFKFSYQQKSVNGESYSTYLTLNRSWQKLSDLIVKIKWLCPFSCGQVLIFVQQCLSDVVS